VMGEDDSAARGGRSGGRVRELRLETWGVKRSGQVGPAGGKGKKFSRGRSRES
jgi:hypothetical protein